MASYEVNDAAVAHVKELIEGRQYVLDSDWGDDQPSADDENAYLENHSWDEYGTWHLGLTEGATDETKARYAFVAGDFRRVHRISADRLRLSRVGVAPQGGRAGRARPASAARQDGRLGPMWENRRRKAMTALRSRLSFANVMSVVAVFIALGGSAWAISVQQCRL